MVGFGSVASVAPLRSSSVAFIVRVRILGWARRERERGDVYPCQICLLLDDQEVTEDYPRRRCREAPSSCKVCTRRWVLALVLRGAVRDRLNTSRQLAQPQTGAAHNLSSRRVFLYAFVLSTLQCFGVQPEPGHARCGCGRRDANLVRGSNVFVPQNT